MSDVTRILQSIEDGDPQAAGQLLPLVYDGLRKLAAQKLAQEQPGQTLQATALVHEAWLRVVDGERRGSSPPNWDGRGHFYAAAAEAMRRIFVDNARRKRSDKHGGGRRVELDVSRLAAPRPPEQLIALSDALDELHEQFPAIAELVKLRYFVGLSIPEAAELLGVSPRTADRYWAYARAWLHDRISSSDEG